MTLKNQNEIAEKLKLVFPKIGVPPKSSILIGFSIINRPFWGTAIFGSTQMDNIFRSMGQPQKDHQLLAGLFFVAWW